MRTDGSLLEERTRGEDIRFFRNVCLTCTVLGILLMLTGFTRYVNVESAVGICGDGCTKVDKPVVECVCNCLGNCADYETRRIVQHRQLDENYAPLRVVGVFLTGVGVMTGAASCPYIYNKFFK